MTAIQYPLINGVRHSFASVELKMAGQIFQGFKSLNYNRTRTRAEVRGNHPDPLGKTIGENAYNADCELYLAEWNAFLKLVGGGDGSGYGDQFFEVTSIYSLTGFDTITDVIRGCTIDTSEASQSQGPDPLVRKVDLKPLKILFNGVDDVLIPLQGTGT